MAFETLVVLWYVLMIAFVNRIWELDLGVGLSLAFLLRFWMDYGLGAALYLLPWVELPDLPVEHLGFTEVVWAFASLFTGWLLARYVTKPTRYVPRYTVDAKLPLTYLFAGVFSQIVLTKTIGFLPSVNAVVASANSLIVVGVALWCWQAYQVGGQAVLIRRFSFTLFLPAFSLLGQGFMSFGTAALMAVLMFVVQIYKPRRNMMVAFAAMIFVGLTFYVNYMRDRTEIRMLVWGGADLTERMSRVWQTITTSELLDLTKNEHVQAINERLNQTVLLGTAVAHLNANDAFFGGSTIVDGVLAIIPRFLWPDKPIGAGSMGLAAQMTGMTFAVGTSVGIGFVMELYGNFGRWGVIIGFFLIGMILQSLDAHAARCLREEDWLGFCQPFLVGLAFVYSWNAVELGMSVGGSLAVAYLIRSFLSRYQKLRMRMAAWA
jgi:hypothetical protein